MASPNAGPITGRERIRVLQGGVDVWLDRPQFVALTALPAKANPPPRPYTAPTTLLGTETFSAWQDGTKITMNAADMATFTAGSGTAPAHPDPNIPTTFTGNELVMGHQSGWRVAWTLDETGQIISGGLPAGYAFLTTNGGQDYLTTNGGTTRLIAKV
ncbi:hypothetical protein [Sphingomonas sp.]|uniref:hypothetical protein n=1 Tax=Sphingomonas sp. TaxID=28214 RepID=UPI003B3AF458